jgi:hypothetical protein
MAPITAQQDAYVEALAAKYGRAAHEPVEGSDDIKAIGLTHEVIREIVRVKPDGVPTLTATVNAKTFRPDLIVISSEDALRFAAALAPITSRPTHTPAEQVGHALRAAAEGTPVDWEHVLPTLTRAEAIAILQEREGMDPDQVISHADDVVIAAALQPSGMPCSDCGALVVHDDDRGWIHVHHPTTCFLAQGEVPPTSMTATDAGPTLAEELKSIGRPTCPFHPDRPQVRNGMCEPCAEKADDAR